MEVFGLLLRVGCVFALLFAVLAVLHRTEAFRAARRTSPMQVLGSTRLGKGAALTVVRIGDAEYVLGVTDHSVSLIAPASPALERATVPAAPEPAAVPDALPADVPARPDFATALGARLGAALSGSPATAASVAPEQPPTPSEFLRSAYRVARRRPAETTDLSNDAVSAALASVRGDEPGPAGALVPAPRTAPDGAGPSAARRAGPPPGRTPDATTPVLTPLVVTPLVTTPVVTPVVTTPVVTTPVLTTPAAADGTATPTSRHALRRAVARTEALRHQEHAWTRSSRPSARTSELDVALG